MSIQSRLNSEEVTFLIVDDDDVCILAMKRALKQLKISNPVLIAKDGKYALDMLNNAQKENQIIPPFLIILDINMPRMNGLEFLEAIRQNPKLERAVVFILSTSDDRNDIEQAYKNNVAGYIVKEDLTDSLLNALSMVDSYSKVIQLPVGFN